MSNNDKTLTKTHERLFKKDFTLVVLGQIISIFGNSVLRFALPLYILDQSGSAALFGAVSALAFLPMIIMSPVGGIIADRVNKQRIMVALDFLTAALIIGFMIVSGHTSITPLVIIMMMLLYGIQGAYSPAVQASLPLLVSGENLVPANAVVNLVNSFSGLLGPVVGGMLYAGYGLEPILQVSAGCFALSAVMELFIRIPHQRRDTKGGMLAIVRDDMRESVHFILKERPVLAKGIVLLFCFNIFLSSMIVIGLPVLVTQTLNMGSRLYGIAQGVMAAGGLAGGLVAGVFGKKLKINNIYLLLVVCAAGILPMVLALLPGVPVMVSYIVITVMCFLLMISATLFSIKMLAFVQAQTPVNIVGKVISFLMAVSMCSQPIGQALYGVLFERLAAFPWVVMLGACIASFLTALFSKRVYSRLSE
ncbi:MAG: MFS transporter [Oscillospiraceae bacterium]|nr:MFS transporter [Oscillospiraceae bacterium]